MKAKVNFYEFKQAIEKIEKVVTNSKKEEGILENCQMTVEGGKLKLQAMKLKYMFGVYLEVKLELNNNDYEEGSTLLNRKFFNGIKKIKNGIEVEITDDDMIIDNRKIKYNDKPYEVEEEDYPHLETSGEEMFTINKNELIDIFKMKYSTSTDEVRETFNGIVFSGDEVITSDTYRLSLRYLRVENHVTDMVNVPLDTVKLFEKIVDKKDDEVKMYYNNKNNNVIFEINNVTLVSKVIESKYPDFKRVIPDKTNYDFIIPGDKLQEELEIIQEFNKKDVDNCVIHLSLSENNVNITTSDKKLSSDIPCYCSEVIKEEVSFNYKFLIDTIKYNKLEEVKLKMENRHKPCIIELENGFDLILPVKVEQAVA